MENWHINAVFYELYPRAFADGNGDGYGDFIGLRQRLEYLEWLGVDCIWMTPVYPSPGKDDGYDIASFYGIDPRFGHLEDFKMAINEIHRRGMRIILDLVVNHTSEEHPWFKEARRSKDSPLRDYYVWSDDPELYNEARIIFLDTEQSNWAYDEPSGQYYWHRFYSSQPDLNYDNLKVYQELENIVRFWLDLGIDGFRVDAVPYLIEREGTNCENLPETHAILQKLRAFVDQNYPHAVLLAEANQWPSEVIHYFGEPEAPEFHMCFNFPVMPRLYMALARQSRADIIEIVDATPPLPNGTQWATFLRNHDELTLEMVSEDDREFMWDYYAPESIMRLNLGIRRRLAPLVNNDRRKIELLHSMLLTLPGAPVLYYGDEIGMGDNLQLPDRNGVRTPMQWSDDVNGGFSSTAYDNLYSPMVSDPEYGYSRVNVEAQREHSTSLLHTVRRMILMRKDNPIFASGSLHWWGTDILPDSLLCFWRADAANGQRVLALHNLSGAPVTLTLPENMAFIDLLQFENMPVSGEIELEAYAYRWLRLRAD